MGRVKIPVSCWCSGTWTPHPLTLSHDLLHGLVGSTSEAARSHAADGCSPSAYHSRVLCVQCGAAWFLWTNLSHTCHVVTFYNYRAAVPFGTWHKASKKQTHSPQVTAVTMQSLRVHTQCVVWTAVRLFVSSAEGRFWGLNDWVQVLASVLKICESLNAFLASECNSLLICKMRILVWGYC